MDVKCGVVKRFSWGCFLLAWRDIKAEYSLCWEHFLLWCGILPPRSTQGNSLDVYPHLEIVLVKSSYLKSCCLDIWLDFSVPVTVLAEVFCLRKFRMEWKAGNSSIIHPGSLRHLLTFQGKKKTEGNQPTPWGSMRFLLGAGVNKSYFIPHTPGIVWHPL